MAGRALNLASKDLASKTPSPTTSRTAATPDTATPHGGSISLEELQGFAADYLIECEYRQQTVSTLTFRRFLLGKLVWFLSTQGHQCCGQRELRLFLHYLSHGHEEPGGRFGNPRLTRPLRPVSLRDYYVHLKCFFAWLVEQDMIPASPMKKLAAPIVNQDHITPLSPEQVTALINAAKKSDWPTRDTAIVLLMLDCGLRATEICTLSLKDVDAQNRSCRVRGKGNKHRLVFYGLNTARYLHRHLRERKADPEAPIFISRDGTSAGGALTRSGLLRLIRRLGRRGGITNVRCSPHTLRHTYAVSFLRAGGSTLTLMRGLGHTNIAMTSKYVLLSNADLGSASKQFSPCDRLRV
jgi:integrase/recombinase XerC